MLTLLERLSLGIFDNAQTSKIPTKFKSKGTITEEGFCDYHVPEWDKSYIEKDNTRAMRIYSSTKARKQRQETRKYRSDGVCGH